MVPVYPFAPSYAGHTAFGLGGEVNLGASHLPQTLEAQMQQKMAAQQQAQQAEYELQKQEMLEKAAVDM
jgi:hypothetical protein